MYRRKDNPPVLVCPLCKQDFHPLLREYGSKNHGFFYEQKYCSKACSNRARGRGEGWLDRHGYRVLNRDRKSPQVYEHRAVMEKMLGRKLTKHETVHHKNGIRHDNRPENLELWAHRHGKGQRVVDVLAHALFADAGLFSGALAFGA